jgi:Ca2+-transporting ATPase
MEKNTMFQNPRPFTNTFFNWKELNTSIIQGLMITAGNLVAYQYAILQGYNEETTRSMVFVVLITSNIILTLVNRSFYYSILTTLKYKNNLVMLIIGITILITTLLIYVKPLAFFFELGSLNIIQLSISILIGISFVIWFEVVKWRNRISFSKNK